MQCNSFAITRMQHFCTYFDRNYLLRGLTMFRSLQATGLDFILHVLALDAETDATIRSLNLSNLRSISLPELERANPRLSSAKRDRTRIEYYFTLSPFLPLHIFDTDSSIDLATYVDADLFFYASPLPLFDELGSRSILICEHRYSPHLKAQQKHGRFNVQYQSFRRDEPGLRCLERWRDQCAEWCHDRFDAGRYADQGYLDEWPSLYADCLAVVAHPGAGLAPWNWATFPLQWNHGRIEVGGQGLIFYHFHGLKIFSPHFISNGLMDWGLMPRSFLRFLYAGYVRQLRETRTWLRENTGRDFAMRDLSIRGAGIALASVPEIARKSWSQAMIVP